MAILVTGGAGYIGSHTLVELAKEGYDAVVLDDLSNSSKESIARVEELTGKTFKLYVADIADRDIYEKIFSENDIEACIHFAGLKAVGESVEKPLMYYQNNITGSLVLFEELAKRNVKKVIFSSSATVYGDPAFVPITEDCPKGVITNPYGRSKSMIEEILMDICVSDPDWEVVLLRYFNPVGAHESGRIGEDPNGLPNNLMPYISQVSVGKLPRLNVFGDDYDTPDGTGVRDYIHVVDLSDGHVKALENMKKGVSIYNLGTGNGTSVLEMVKAYEEASGVEIPYVITDRRPGDVGNVYCDASKAEKELGWKAVRDIKQMCADTWNWQSHNPNGYED